MDKIRELASKASSSSGSSSASNTSNTAGGSEDYGDKGLDAIEKKAGMSQSRATNEKITDGARNFLEKETGKDIPTKFSN